MNKAIGIDLGTTNTVVAVLLDGRPQVLEDDRGYRVLPSVVLVDEFGAEVVGHAARNRILTDPDRTLYAIKRLMGRRFDSDQAAEARQRVGYAIEAAPDGTCMVVAAGRRLTPVEVSAMILRTAREMAERALGESVADAVITVPAYFNHQQRTATLEAAQLAGLRCDRLVNEPTAAALAYGFRKDIDRTLLIYDLGGGTFDVSVLHLAGGVYEILATRGDTFLGGEDFDYRLVDYLADHFQTQTGFDLRGDRMALQRIKDAAERAKCELSFTDKTTVLVPRLTPDKNLELAITRLTRESLVEDLVERSVEVTRKAVADAGLNLSDLDDIILVGGQTRMPRVREAISGLFGKEPSRGVHPEEVVAIGAAVHASSIMDTEGAPTHVLIDVTPFDLGIDVAGGLFQTVVSRNSHVPSSDTRVFATTRDDQDSVRITVRQGDSRFADENEFLGEFTMEGLTRAPRMETKVEVTFRIDSNGMLHVAAVEPGTGEARRITVRNYAEVAESKGAVPVQLETDGKGPANGAAKAGGRAEAPAAMPAAKGKKPTRGDKAAAPAAASKSGGFLAGLLGGRKKDKGAPATPAAPGAGAAVPPAAVSSGAAPAAAASSAADAGARATPPISSDALAGAGAALAAGAAGAAGAAAAPFAGRINLPSPGLLDDIDSGELEALDGDAIHPEALDSGELEPLPDAASIGLAGGGGDAWDSPDDGFEMPAYDEDEDEDHVPVGMAGGGYVHPVDDDVFDLPEDDDGLEEAGGPQEAPVEETEEEELLGMDEDALAGLGEDAFADLGEDAFADLGVDPFSDPKIAPAPRTSAPTPASPAPLAGDDLFDDLGGQDLDQLAAELFDMPDESDEHGGDRRHSGLRPPSESGTGRHRAVGARLDEPDTSELFDFTTSLTGATGRPAAAPSGEPLFLPPPDLQSRGGNTLGEELFGTSDEDAGEMGELESDDRLFSLPAGLTDRSAPRQDNDEKTEIFARSPGPGTRSAASRRRRRKPARLKLAYRQVDAMIAEYRENLRRGGCFVKTTKPLPVGRECVIEVRAPGMDEPLSITGVVTWSSVGLSTLPAGQDPGMGIEYRLDEQRRGEIERVLSGLAG